MRTKLVSVLALLVLLGAYLPPVPAQASEVAALLVSTRDSQGLELILTVPPVSLQERDVAGRPYTAIDVPGLFPAGEPGAPELPQLTARLVVPPDVPVSLEVLEEESEVLALAVPPLPAPRAVVGPGPEGEGPSVNYVYEERVGYGQDGLTPSALCEISADDVVREWRLLQVTCNPVRYRGVDNTLYVTRSARLRLAYPDATSDEPAVGVQATDPLAGVLAAGVLNSGDLARYRSAAPDLSAAALPEPPGRYRLMVDEPGIYSVSYDELKAAGLDLAGVKSNTLRLFEGTQEVAILVEDADGTFGAGDRFLFYGRQRQSVYGTTNSYLLDWGGAAGRRVQSRPAGSPGTGTTYLQAEALLRNYDPRWPDPWRSDWTDVYIYDPAYSDAAEDGHFYAGTLGTLAPKDMPDREWFAVSVPGAAGQQGTLSVTLSGATDTPHAVDFAFGSTASAYTICVPFVARGAGVSGAATTAQAVEPPYTDLGQRSWTGAVSTTFDFSVPVSDGLHVLRLSLPGQSDGAGGLISEKVMVTAPRLIYPVGRATTGTVVGQGQPGSHTYRVAGFGSPNLMVWDVTDPSAPTALTGVSAEAAGGRWWAAFADAPAAAATYVVTSTQGIKRVGAIAKLQPVALTPAAQYLIVTHPDFLQAAQALAQYRHEASGLSTRVVTTQAIYDRYSGGLMDAEAIRSFVRQAYSSWLSADSSHLLTYLVLVGDGSYDFKNRLNHGLANYLPPYLGEDFDPHWGGQSGSDHMFANERGVPPSVLVGRIPVRTASEAMAVVQKVIRYEGQGGATWSRALFAADDPDMGDYGTGAPLNYSFSDMAEAALETVRTDPRLGQADMRRAYHSATQTTAPGFYYRESDAGTKAVLDAWRAGTLLTYYAGHSHFWGWAFPQLFHADHIEELGPSPLTLLLSMTCFTGVFYHPTAPSLDEALLSAPDRGTITSLSPMSMGSAAGHRRMQGDIIRTLLAGGSIGEAMLAGKLTLGSAYRDLVDTYGVLGDPALGFASAPTDSTPNQTMLPLVANGVG
ncbi:MAG: C25 family cysteine peptidase [Anaerolineae bacterium]|jgi:hypothetical protein